MRVLMVTSEWPTDAHPQWVPFLVRQVESLNKAGVDIQVFPFRGGKNPLNYLKVWFQLRRQYLLADFDLIHAQFGQSGLVALPAPVPVVVTLHGSDLQGYIGESGRPTLSGKILTFISKVVASKADAVIVVSDALAKKLSRHSQIIPCGVDLTLFQPIENLQAREYLGWSKDEKMVLFVGNPANPIKRHWLAKEAVEFLKKSTQADLVTISDVPHGIMPFYLNAADVLLVTSKHEGSPTIIKEAMACNLPIVTVDVGDIKQQIVNIEGCAVCEVDSPVVIAENLKRVLARNRRTNSRAAIHNLDESKIAQRIIEVYHSVLE